MFASHAAFAGAMGMLFAVKQSFISPESFTFMESIAILAMGLAPLIVEQIFETILELNRSGVTILLVEQNAHQALQVANRGYVIATGEITTGADAKELLRDPAVKEAYLGGH